MAGGMEDLERGVTDELALAESSQPEQAMLQSPSDWQFDPFEVEPYEVELRTLRDAVEVVEEHNRSDHTNTDPEVRNPL